MPLALGLAILALAAAVAEATPRPEAPLPDGLRCLLAAYPETICGATADGLELCSGERIPWTDGRDKVDHDTLLNEADLRDQMAMRYRPGRPEGPPPHLHEPGRVRHQPLFDAMYGATRDAVSASMRPVPWLVEDGGGVVQMTAINGAAAALERVSDDIARELPEELRRIAARHSGTFVWRNIRGTSRRSVHSYGIAIDVGVHVSDYWAWNKPGADGRYTYKNRFPWAIAAIFERHGFIWGGKWYHFDTMHFEYRPELLVEPCVLPAR